MATITIVSTLQDVVARNNILNLTGADDVGQEIAQGNDIPVNAAKPDYSNDIGLLLPISFPKYKRYNVQLDNPTYTRWITDFHCYGIGGNATFVVCILNGNVEDSYSSVDDYPVAPSLSSFRSLPYWGYGMSIEFPIAPIKFTPITSRPIPDTTQYEIDFKSTEIPEQSIEYKRLYTLPSGYSLSTAIIQPPDERTAYVEITCPNDASGISPFASGFTFILPAGTYPLILTTKPVTGGDNDYPKASKAISLDLSWQ